MTPLVTIITVTYNSSKYVRDAIIGVLAQTYKNIEYIIADDCSTDNTWDIINEYKDERIVAYRNESNLREYPNRNKAISLAKGEYLIFIDGDDVIFPTAIEYLMYYAQKFPEAAILIQKNYFENLLFPILLSPKQSFINVYFGKKNLLSSSFTANFFKTTILKNAGCLSTKFISGDDEVRLRIATQHPIVLLQGWVSWPRKTPNQASSKIDIIKSYDESFAMLTLIKENQNRNIEITDEMIESAKLNRMKIIAKSILFHLKSRQVKRAYKIAKKFKINTSNFLSKLRYKTNFTDEFSSHRAENPYKQDFIKICNTKIY